MQSSKISKYLKESERRTSIVIYTLHLSKVKPPIMHYVRMLYRQIEQQMFPIFLPYQ